MVSRIFRLKYHSQHAETRLAFSADCTGAVTFSQANIYRLGPWVRVVPDIKESLYSRKPTFVGLNLFVRVALQSLESQSVSKCFTSVSKCHELKETVACLETVKSAIYFNKLSFWCCCSLKNTSK